VELVALLKHAHTRQWSFGFRTPKQRVKVVDFDVCQNVQKLIGYNSEGHFPNFAQNGNVLKGIKKEVQTRKFTQISFIW